MEEMTTLNNSIVDVLLLNDLHKEEGLDKNYQCYKWIRLDLHNICRQGSLMGRDENNQVLMLLYWINFSH